mgnify:FL=1
MLIRKDIEAIFSTPELWQAFHDLEELYHYRRSSPEMNARYKAAFRIFKTQVEGSKGQIIPF